LTPIVLQAARSGASAVKTVSWLRFRITRGMAAPPENVLRVRSPATVSSRSAARPATNTTETRSRDGPDKVGECDSSLRRHHCISRPLCRKRCRPCVHLSACGDFTAVAHGARLDSSFATTSNGRPMQQFTDRVRIQRAKCIRSRFRACEASRVSRCSSCRVIMLVRLRIPALIACGCRVAAMRAADRGQGGEDAVLSAAAGAATWCAWQPIVAVEKRSAGPYRHLDALDRSGRIMPQARSAVLSRWSARTTSPRRWRSQHTTLLAAHFRIHDGGASRSQCTLSCGRAPWYG